MRVTHWGHACVEVSLRAGGVPRRILIDPGSFSPEVAAVSEVDAVLLTHEHVDHADPALIRRLRDQSPRLQLLGNAPTTAALAAAGIGGVRQVAAGDRLLDGAVEVLPGRHEPVHGELPVPASVAYRVGGGLVHPGDGFVSLAGPVDLLLLPVAGPWMQLAAAVDHLRAVAPHAVLPIHQGGLVEAHQRLHRQVVRQLAPAGTEVLAAELGVPVDV